MLAFLGSKLGLGIVASAAIAIVAGILVWRIYDAGGDAARSDAKDTVIEHVKERTDVEVEVERSGDADLDRMLLAPANRR